MRLVWETIFEERTASFDISRSSSPTGPFAPISGQIPAAGTDSSGAVYEFLDPAGSSGDYYSLAETEFDSVRNSPCTPIIKADEQPGVLAPVGVQIAEGLNPNYAGTASTGPPYDALIICPDAWVASLDTLRDHWAGFRHHATLLTPLSQLGTTKEGIRSYILSHTQAQYVLLVGDTENRLQPGNAIPTWHVQDDLGRLATDAPYADRDGDGLADFALGRWPAHDSLEAAVCASKSIRYDYQDPASEYRRRWLGMVYDYGNPYGGGIVPGEVSRAHGDSLLALTPGVNGVVGWQYRATELACCREVRQDTAIAAINRGAHVIWTLSTSSSVRNSEFLYSGEHLRRCSDPPNELWSYRPVDLTRFEPYGACGFWLQLSCLLGGIDLPDYHARLLDCDGPEISVRPLAEELLMVPDANGVLTWFGPTWLSYQSENYWVGREVLSRLTYENPLSIGWLCMEAAKSLGVARPWARLRASSYMFLGDPTIVPTWTIPPVPTEVSSGSVVRAYALSAHPNPGRGTVGLQFSLMHPTDVTLSVYDVAGRLVRVLARGPFRDGVHRGLWDGRDEGGREVAAGVYLVQLRTEERILNQKLVLVR